MLRRRHFFERRDEQWTEMLPYQSAIKFWELVTGQVEVGGLLRDVLMALNRGEGLSDPGRLGNSLERQLRESCADRAGGDRRDRAIESGRRPQDQRGQPRIGELLFRRNP